MIIVTIIGPKRRDANAQVAGSAQYADMFEIRLDLLDRPDLGGLLAKMAKPAIVTCRRVRDGGKFRGAEKIRRELLVGASLFGAEFVDVEMNAPPSTLRHVLSWLPPEKVIVSHHLWSPKPINVRRVFESLDRTGAEVIKFAYTPFDASDIAIAAEFLALARRRRRKAIAIAMGEAGEASRALYRKFGGWATFAGTEDGKTAAPGQLSARQLKEVFRAGRLNSSTKVFGVVGGVLRQSKGVFIHNALFRRAGRNAVYCKFPVVDPDKFVRRMGPYLHGFSVTIPHKERLLRLVDHVDQTGKKIGAVNTVLRRGSRLVATNTDAPAALDAIEQVRSVKGKRMAILGAGGAARAIAYEARKRGANVWVANRTRRNALRLVHDIGVRVVTMSAVSGKNFDVLVNATPVGMFPKSDATPLDKRRLAGFAVVFDVVYNPSTTRLLREASGLGAKVIRGGEMYIRQAAMQSALFSGSRPDIGLMRRILKKQVGHRRGR